VYTHQGNSQQHPIALPSEGPSDLDTPCTFAVLCGLRRSCNKNLKEFYDKKREEGKPYRVAVIACVNKLLHWIYAVLKVNNLSLI